MADDRSTDHRYLQVARALRKEIVDGVYPVGSQLPTEHQLCERFSVSRYTVREALRRLRDDNLVASRPRAGTLVVPRPSSDSYVQDVVSINDLLAFATGAQFAIESTGMVTHRRRAGQPEPGLAAAKNGWPCAVSGRSRVRSSRCAGPSTTSTGRLPAVGRLLQRHTGPIFPLIEDLFGLSIVEVRQEIAAVLISPVLAAELSVERRQPGARSAPHLHHVRRRGRPGDDQYASRRAFPSLDDDATGPRLISTRRSA